MAEVDAKHVVLIIDDEDLVRNLTGKILERSGFGVLKASGGIEGIEQFKACTDEIDAVMVDMTMPDLDGGAVFSAVRKLRADIPVLLTSGFKERETETWFSGQDGVLFLQKPFQRRALLTMLKRLLPET